MIEAGKGKPSPSLSPLLWWIDHCVNSSQNPKLSALRHLQKLRISDRFCSWRVVNIAAISIPACFALLQNYALIGQIATSRRNVNEWLYFRCPDSQSKHANLSCVILSFRVFRFECLRRRDFYGAFRSSSSSSLATRTGSLTTSTRPRVNLVAIGERTGAKAQP